MTEWQIICVLVVLIGLVTAIVTPIIKLNTTITKLTGVVEFLSKDLSELTNNNTESHRRIWDEVDLHKEELHDHDKRIVILENKDRQ